MLLAGETEEQGDAEEQVHSVDYPEPTRVGKGFLGVETPLFEGMLLAGETEEQGDAEEQVDGDEQGRQAKIYQIDMDHALKVLSMQQDEPEVQEVVDVVTTAKIITKVVTAASELVTTASITISAVEPQVPAAAITTAAQVRVATAFTRRRKGVVIRDLEEESTVKIPTETKSKDKGKGIMVEEPNPMKKKQ
nr:hypothetical protein [Tanacetum cinerariifolium]